MKKVLILGGSGMLGHRLWLELRKRPEVFHAKVTLRDRAWPGLRFIYPNKEWLERLNVRDFGDLEWVLGWEPDAVVNCIGLVKQRPEANDVQRAIEINALFPHRLADACEKVGARLIHISTDCVFHGGPDEYKEGPYSEECLSDAHDLYGRTKYLGEVNRPNALTLRTSIIGRELRTSQGLLEWYLGIAGTKCDGYERCFFSGLTTIALSRIIAELIERNLLPGGLYNVASDRISKLGLLQKLSWAYGHRTKIRPVDFPECDRWLNGTRFFRATGIGTPTWDEMVKELAQDPTPYDAWRQHHAE